VAIRFDPGPFSSNATVAVVASFVRKPTDFICSAGYLHGPSEGRMPEYQIFGVDDEGHIKGVMSRSSVTRRIGDRTRAPVCGRVGGLRGRQESTARSARLFGEIV
jgi:hypothetical protein